jgi:hypothetical protein
MKQITQSAVSAIAAVLLVTGTVSARSVSAPQPPRMVAAKSIPAPPIGFASRPGTPAERVARLLMAEVNPIVLVAYTRLAGSEVLFVHIQSSRECGSAGCDTVSFKQVHGRWVKILDTVGGTIRVAGSHHRGMPDLIVKDTNRLIWDGSRYD